MAQKIATIFWLNAILMNFVGKGFSIFFEINSPFFSVWVVYCKGLAITLAKLPKKPHKLNLSFNKSPLFNNSYLIEICWRSLKLAWLESPSFFFVSAKSYLRVDPKLSISARVLHRSFPKPSVFNAKCLVAAALIKHFEAEKRQQFQDRTVKITQQQW